MTLTDAELHLLEVPLNGEYVTSHHDALPSMIVPLAVLRDDDGAYGLGTAEVTEGYSHQSPEEVYESLRDVLLPRLLREQPASPNALLETLEAVPGHVNAKGVAQMAYLDLHGKRRESSIADLLGGALREEEPLNGWVGIDEPDGMVAEVRELADGGFTGVKIKLSGDREADIARVEAICEAMGDRLQIRADANCGYEDVDDAIAVAKRMEDFDVAHFEQPIARDDLVGLKRLSESTSTPIMADECIGTLPDVLTLLRDEVADRMKFKILRLGGILQAKTAFDVTALAGMDCVLGHGFGLATSTSAEVQLASATRNVFRPLECVGSLKFDDQPFRDQLAIDRATARVPSGPGLGVELVEADLSRYSTRSTTVD